MAAEMVFIHCLHCNIPGKPSLALPPLIRNAPPPNIRTQKIISHRAKTVRKRVLSANLGRRNSSLIVAAAAAAGGGGGGMPMPPLDLTEDNIRQVLADARNELGQIFDESVNITGKAELAELDGPFVKISLKGRFWHERSMVLARVGNYLKLRIPEILEVEIEDEKQLDDSPANF